MSTLNSNQNWKLLEDRAEVLFRNSGFTTRRNVEIDGYEYDILAEKTDVCGIAVRIVIECKYNQRRRTAYEDLSHFINSFETLRINSNYRDAIIVTNHGLSRTANNAIEKKNHIKAFTIVELEDSLVGVHIYLSLCQSRYKSYVESKFISLDGNDIQSGEDAKHTVDICADIDGFQSAHRKSLCIILGDYGTGKTTIAEKLHNYYANKYRLHTISMYPIILYLRTLTQHETDQSFIYSQTADLDRNISKNFFNYTVKCKETILILDGFDEVATNSTKEERIRYFSRVMNIANNARHIIITSRPSYFTNMNEFYEIISNIMHYNEAYSSTLPRNPNSRDEHATIAHSRILKYFDERKDKSNSFLFEKADTRIYRLSPLTKDKIIGYIDRFSEALFRKYKRSTIEIYEMLSRIYDLSDLMSRPILLDIIVDVLLNANIKIDDAFLVSGPIGLYKLYIEDHLDRDWEVRQFLKREERHRFAQAAALAMLENGGSLEASYQAVADIVRRGVLSFDGKRREELLSDMPRVANDVRVCSFIDITQDDKICFSHKSFMEYFVAEVIAEQVVFRKPFSALNIELNYEILYFVGAHCLLRSDTRHDIEYQIKNISYKQSKNYATNLRVALLLSENHANQREFKNIEYSSITLRRKCFYGCQFSGLTLLKAHISDIFFDSCTFINLKIAGIIKDIKIANSKGIITCGSEINQIKVVENSLVSIISDIYNFTISGEFVGSEIKVGTSMLPGSTLRIHSSKFSKSSLTLQSRSIDIVDTQFKHCIIKNADGEQRIYSEYNAIIVSNTYFNEVVFHSICLDESVCADIMKNDILIKCSGVIIVRDERRIFTKFRHKGRGDIEKYRGWWRFGGVVFVSSWSYSRLIAERGEYVDLFGCLELLNDDDKESWIEDNIARYDEVRLHREN